MIDTARNNPIGHISYLIPGSGAAHDATAGDGVATSDKSLPNGHRLAKFFLNFGTLRTLLTSNTGDCATKQSIRQIVSAVIAGFLAGYSTDQVRVRLGNWQR